MKRPASPTRARRRPLPAVIPATPSDGAETPAATPPVAPVAPRMPLTWARALDLWKQRLRSEKTQATYLSQVGAFITYVPYMVGPADVTEEVLTAYAGALAYRAQQETDPAKRLSPATVNLKIAALRSFLHFARKRKWLSADLTAELISDALTGIKAHVQRPYQIVEGDEVERMLTAAAADTTNPARAVALVGLALKSGLRLAELCALDVGDLATDATSCYVDVRQGKGNNDRQVPIAEDVYALVLAYLAETGRAVWVTADRATPLFLSRNRNNGDGGRLSERQAEIIVGACARRAGMLARGKRITPHSLRHSYAIDVLRGDAASGRPGAPLPAVAKLLGHSSVAVTGKYLAHFERGELATFAPRLRRSVQGVQGEQANKGE